MSLSHASSTTHADIHDIPVILTTLRDTAPPDGGVLSAYISTPLVGVAGRAYLASFRDGCRELRASLAPDALAGFDQAVAHADRFLDGAFVPRQPGLALFAAADPNYFFSVPLPRAPSDEFVWGPGPALVSLEEIVDDFERVAVAMIDMSGARLFTIFLGQIEEREDLESDVPGQQATGRWGGVARANVARQHEAQPSGGMARGPRGGGMAAARYARHHREAHLAHTRDTAHAVMELLRRRSFDRLFLAGPTESVALLRQELPRPLRARLAGELSLAMTANDDEVRRAALEAAEAVERATEVELVDELLEAATTPRASLGLDATLAALNDKRVSQLFLADTFATSGGECPTSDRLVSGAGTCPTCGEQTTPLDNLRERIAERAVDQGARLEIVSGEAATRLMEHDGIGAWTRY